MGYPAHLLNSGADADEDTEEDGTVAIQVEEDHVPTQFEVRTLGNTKVAYFASQPKPKNRASLSSAVARAHASSTALAAERSAGGQSHGQFEDIFSARESPLIAGVYARYRVSQQKSNAAEIARVERLMRDEMREQNAMQQYEESQQRRARVRGRNEKARNDLMRFNLEGGRRIREQRELISEQVEQQRQQFHADVQARVALGRKGGNGDDTEYATLDARLDAQEEEEAEALRQEHARAKREHQLALQTNRHRMSTKNKEQADHLRRETSERLGHALNEAHHKKASLADEKRLLTDQGKALFAEYEDEHQQKAAAAKAFAKASRANAQRAREQLVARKAQDVAAAQRTAMQEIAASREKLLRDNQARRRAVFSSRYASRDALTHFAGSTFQKLYEMDDMSDAQIAEGNVEIFQRIAFAAPRTDDLIDDEAAGKARKTFAAKSRAQKAAEASRIAKENDEIKKRIRNTQASTDNMLDDEVAATRRIELAAESKARRAREAVELAVRNEELQRRLHAVKAITDDDMLDEAAGRARARAAAASAATHAAEAAKLARKNVSLKKAIANTAAKTDDNVMDEDAGLARGKLETESRRRKLAQAKKLAKSNADMKTRLKNVKPVVDDDITDDAAGKARKGWFAWGS